MKNDPQALLKQLSASLKLTYEVQDWGIINADAQRLCEFISYYKRNKMERTQAYQVFELILASFNEKLQEEATSSDELRTFITQHGKDFPDQIEYWKDLKNDEEFPIAKDLRLFTQE